MREKEFKAVFDGEKYVMPQDMKYRVKNKISEKTASKTAKPIFKRSASAMISIVLVSVLVITAAAIGGIALFKSIYGGNIDLIIPYSEQLNLAVSDENYELTLHEAVADEYTTAYILSVKRLTLGASEAPESESTMVFKSFNQMNNSADRLLKYYTTQDNPEYFKAFNEYGVLENQIYQFERIFLIRTNTAYDADNEAKYLVRTIDDLKTADTDYYALYIINGEDQTLSIGVGSSYRLTYLNSYRGPEITLPKVTQKAPSVTRSVQEYYRQYLKQTDPTVLFGSRRLADSVTVTPLAVYVDGAKGIKSIWASGIVKYIEGAFYRTAELVFNDSTEKSLSEMSQDEVGILVNDTTGVYLFNEVLDTSLVKSFLVYDTVEFPMDENAPVIDRETGESIVPKYETLDLMYDVGDGMASYIDSTYPADRAQNKIYCWGPSYLDENFCKLNAYDCDMTLTVYDAVEGETLADAANRLIDENRTKYNWAISAVSEKDGTFSYGDIRYVDVSASVMGGDVSEYHYFFFATNGKLLVIHLVEKDNAWPYYSLDAIKQLITFS